MAYHLVIEREVEGLDASACGKALDQAESLGHVADCAGAQPLAAFFSEDWSAPAVYAGVFGPAGIEHPDDGFPATRWFPAEEGLAWVRSLLSYLVADPTIVSDGIVLIDDLRGVESVFGRLVSSPK